MNKEQSLMDDPLCGNCGQPRSKHYTEPHRDELFCNLTTTGDIYRTEPREDLILGMMMDRYPELYEGLVDEWKVAHGHLSPEEATPASPFDGDATLEMAKMLVEASSVIDCAQSCIDSDYNRNLVMKKWEPIKTLAREIKQLLSPRGKSIKQIREG